MKPQPPAGQWADEPLRAAAPDLLGREAFVHTVAQRIDRAAVADPSVVFGLVGPWGSGKSSLLNRIRGALSDDWVIGEFTPWSTGDSGALSIEFVTTLASVLGAKPKGATRRMLAQYASYGVPLLAAAPIVGGGLSGSMDKLLGRAASRPPWHEEFASLSDEISKLGRRVLIVIDDVDRLGSDELLALLRVVRLLGRFVGVHYLIAYDQGTVEDLLAAHGVAGRSATFMEKIVQYPFEVPPIARAAAVRLINQAISELVSETGAPLGELDVQRLSELVGSLAPLVDTPRRFGRFREQLRSFAGHVVEAELDVLDFAAVTWLRLNAHGVWWRLTDWREELSRGSRMADPLHSIDIPVDEWVSRIREAHSAADSPHVIRLLSFLFPGVAPGGVSSYIAHERPLAEEAYFPRYMLLTLPEDDVSDRLIQEVLDAEVAGVESFRKPELTALFDSDDEALAYLGYLRAEKQRESASTTSVGLLRYIAERMSARQNDPPGIGVPLNALRSWLAHEVALALSTGSISAQEVTELFGEDEAISLVFAMTRLANYRDRRRELARGFSDYWRSSLGNRFDELVATSKLGGVIDLIVYASEDEQARGLLDAKVTSFEEYLRIAEAFVMFREWVGSSSKSYEMTFRGSLFAAVVSAAIRAKFANGVRELRTDLDFEIDELPAPEVSDVDRRAFVLNALVDLDGQ